MDDLDALLADLQNTVSSGPNHVSNNATPGYGSLNGARNNHTSNVYRTYENRTSPLPPQSVSEDITDNTTFRDKKLPQDRHNLCIGEISHG